MGEGQKIVQELQSLLSGCGDGLDKADGVAVGLKEKEELEEAGEELLAGIEEIGSQDLEIAEFGVGSVGHVVDDEGVEETVAEVEEGDVDFALQDALVELEWGSAVELLSDIERDAGTKRARDESTVAEEDIESPDAKYSRIDDQQEAVTEEFFKSGLEDFL
ncbi:hypothetical protein NDN08_008224 [Rhodosorus marinus]|uniref:Uncharacterized protein n=1 Tax=Rhodosorus marinus TaxID=101924 RepID=A0AAV8V049_9RHOD|nr:hypothetical protein NDN08_008224 [Rhodosorus marinus]